MISKYRKILEQQKGQKQSLEKQLRKQKKKLRVVTRELKSSEEALLFIQTVAKKTQDQLEYDLSNLVTIGMASVLPDPYELKLNFSLRRNRVETDVKFTRRGMEIDPMSGSAGGAVHIGGLAMRASIHFITRPRRRDVLLLDEPLSALKGNDMPKRGSELIKEISNLKNDKGQKIGPQIIMVSHSKELIESADKVFSVEAINGISEVKEGI